MLLCVPVCVCEPFENPPFDGRLNCNQHHHHHRRRHHPHCITILVNTS